MPTNGANIPHPADKNFDLDADAELTAAFAAQLLGEAPQRMVLAVSLDHFLSQTPEAEGLTQSLWNFCEPETLEQGFELYKLAGAEALCTQTWEGLQPNASYTASDLAQRAHRTAQSAGPHYIVGAIGPWGTSLAASAGEPDSVPTLDELLNTPQARAARERYRNFAQALVQAGCHALIYLGFSHLTDLACAVQAAAQVTQCALIATLNPADTNFLPNALIGSSTGGSSTTNSNVPQYDTTSRLSFCAQQLEHYGAHALAPWGVEHKALIGQMGSWSNVCAAHDLCFVPLIEADKPLNAAELSELGFALRELGLPVVACGRGLSASQLASLCSAYVWGER